MHSEATMPNTVNSRPYVWPYHGAVRTHQTALLVLTDADAIARGASGLANLRLLAGRARLAGIRVVHLPHAGHTSALDVAEGDLVVTRPAYGGFTGTDLALVLENARISDLLIAGFPVELGADCTMREANDLGYECLLLEDCCTWLSEQTRAGAISSVQMSGGIFGAVASSKDFLAALNGF
jgi:nicotinamidase-related amidase